MGCLREEVEEVGREQPELAGLSSYSRPLLEVEYQTTSQEVLQSHQEGTPMWLCPRERMYPTGL